MKKLLLAIVLLLFLVGLWSTLDLPPILSIEFWADIFMLSILSWIVVQDACISKKKGEWYHYLE